MREDGGRFGGGSEDGEEKGIIFVACFLAGSTPRVVPTE